jgi:hypothetical protein
MAYKFNKIVNYWHYPLVVLLAVIFFISSSSYILYTQKENFVKWQSPDETANYTFAKIYAETSKISFFEKYNLIADDIIHPRSMRSDFGEVKPVSFLGIILIYGAMAKILGTALIPYFTPFFGSIAIIFYYLLIQKIFGRKNALISSFLLTFFPVLLYYSARAMFHNVLFISLFVIGAYFLVLASEKRLGRYGYLNYFFCFIAGSALGGSLMARTSELIWVGPVLLILWMLNIKRFHPAKALIFLVSLAIFMLPMFSWNYYLYGSAFRGGYVEMNTAITNITQGVSELKSNSTNTEIKPIQKYLKVLKDNLFYFGINFHQSKNAFNNYFVKMFAWLFYLSVLGAVILALNRHYWKKRYGAFIISWLLSSVILIIYYGSWRFNDNPDPSRATIGNSYTRYWLPIYLGAIPLASLSLMRLSSAIVFFKVREGEITGQSWPKKLKRQFSYLRPGVFRFGVLSIAILLLILNFSAFTLYGSEEGLFYSYYNQLQGKSEYDKIIDSTEENAVIVTFYYDKIVFPQRKVIIGNLNDVNMNKIYSTLAKKMPVYYLHFKLNKNDIDYLNQSRLADLDLKIKNTTTLSKSFGLYQLEYSPKADDNSLLNVVKR